MMILDEAETLRDPIFEINLRIKVEPPGFHLNKVNHLKIDQVIIII